MPFFSSWREPIANLWSFFNAGFSVMRRDLSKHSSQLNTGDWYIGRASYTLMHVEKVLCSLLQRVVQFLVWYIANVVIVLALFQATCEQRNDQFATFGRWPPCVKRLVDSQSLHASLLCCARFTSTPGAPAWPSYETCSNSTAQRDRAFALAEKHGSRSDYYVRIHWQEMKFSLLALFGSCTRTRLTCFSHLLDTDFFTLLGIALLPFQAKATSDPFRSSNLHSLILFFSWHICQRCQISSVHWSRRFSYRAEAGRNFWISFRLCLPSLSGSLVFNIFRCTYVVYRYTHKYVSWMR